MLTLTREESPQQKLRKLEGWLVQYGFSPAHRSATVCLVAVAAARCRGYAPMDVTPAQHKHQTLQAILTALLQRAAQQPVLFAMEDLDWADASTLELLHLLVDQVPRAQVLVLLTFRPEFTPLWGARSHVAQVTLTRLSQQQTEAMIARLTQGKALQAEVHQQLVLKTDGVPLFVEELTRMVLESGLLSEREERYELTGPLPALAIPTTLHDSLMAQVDQLATGKEVLQVGATLGQEFSMTSSGLWQCWMRTPSRASCVGWSRRNSCTGAGSVQGQIPLQACPDSGHRLSADAAEQAATGASDDCPGAGEGVCRDHRDAA